MSKSKKYSHKWGITYNGKTYLVVYGKRNAYELRYRLSKFLKNLEVEPVFESLKKEPDQEREHSNEYYRKWREQNRKYYERWRSRNPDKVRAYYKKYLEQRKKRIYTMPE